MSQDAKNSVLVVHSGLRLSAKDILKHEWFNKDGVTVTQARQVMGLRPDMTEERDSGKGNIRFVSNYDVYSMLFCLFGENPCEFEIILNIG